MVNFTPLPLYPPGKEPLYPLNKRLGGPQRLSGRFLKRKNPLAPTGILFSFDLFLYF